MFTLITGASRGIGAAFARRLAAEGHSLILVARDGQQLASLKAELQGVHPGRVELLVADLAKPDSAAAIYHQCQHSGWQVGQLINNAGCGRFGEFLDHPVETYQDMIQLNVLTPVSLAHHFLGGMQQRGQGIIINVASMAAFQPTPYLSVYGATKAFLLAFSEALAGECIGTSIRVLAICPGATRTDFFRAAGRGETEIVRGAPAMQSAEVVVDVTLQALRSGGRLVVPGWKNRLMTAVASHLPRWLSLPMSARVLKRQFGIRRE